MRQGRNSGANERKITKRWPSMTRESNTNQMRGNSGPPESYFRSGSQNFRKKRKKRGPHKLTRELNANQMGGNPGPPQELFPPRIAKFSEKTQKKGAKQHPHDRRVKCEPNERQFRTTPRVISTRDRRISAKNAKNGM